MVHLYAVQNRHISDSNTQIDWVKGIKTYVMKTFSNKKRDGVATLISKKKKNNTGWLLR